MMNQFPASSSDAWSFDIIGSPSAQSSTPDFPVSPDIPRPGCRVLAGGPHTDDSLDGPPLKLDSFFPILDLLPGIFVDDKTYRLKGTIREDDRQRVLAFAKRVDEFTISDIGDPGQRKIAPATFLRLLGLCDSGKPFFPSLSRLLISDAGPSLWTLPFFSTPSLRSLQVGSIQGGYEQDVHCYLGAMVDEAPQVVSIDCCMERLPRDSLATTLGFSQLRHLELKNISPEVISASISRIASLQDLNSLVIVTQCAGPPSWERGGSLSDGKVEASEEGDLRRLAMPKSLYSEWQACLAKASQQSTSSPCDASPSCLTDGRVLTEQSPSSDQDHKFVSNSGATDPSLEIRDGLSDVTPSQVENRIPGFQRLTNISLTAPLFVLKEIFDQISSTVLADVAIVLLATNPDSIPWYQSGAGCNNCGKIMKPKPSSLAARKNLKVGPQSRCYDGCAAIHISAMVELEASVYASILDSITNRTASSISSLYIGQVEGQTIAPLTLAPEMLRKLLAHPSLQDLHIVGWNCGFVDDVLREQSGRGKEAIGRLRTLQLPMSGSNDEILLSTMRSIAEGFPNLLSLQCRIKPLANLTQEFTSTTDHPMSHGLKQLSVGKSSLPADLEDLLPVARHLDLLFPELEMIKAQDDNNSKKWAFVNNLIGMCQTARRDDRARALVSCSSLEATP